MEERGIPREHYPVLIDGEEIGQVTSGTMSPTFKKGIGMALVDGIVIPGSEIHINIRDKLYLAKVVKRPIYNFMGGK